jgi:GNAT superfamily N-acetyltransferase
VPIISPVPASAVRPLRRHLLRPDLPTEGLIYPGDDDPLALHLGAVAEGRLFGIATIYPEAPPQKLQGAIPEAAYRDGASFRLRGMATRPDQQRRGIGRRLMEGTFYHALDAGASYYWCNARVGAKQFYESMRLEAVGDIFDLGPAGPHYVMWRRL